MTYGTLEDIIQDTIQALSQVPGTSVETYAEDRIAQAIIQNFDMLFDELWWKSYTDWYTWTLDGSTGHVVDDVSQVLTRYEDIDKIRVPNQKADLPEHDDSVAPDEVTGTHPLSYTSSTTSDKIFKVVPAASTGSIYVRCRTKPVTITPATQLKIDNTLLVLMSAWDITTDDNANDAASNRFLQKMQQRYEQVHSYYGSKARSIFRNGNTSTYPQEWF